MYGCEFIKKKEEQWIDFTENAKIKDHCGFILLKLLIKCRAVN